MASIENQFVSIPVDMLGKLEKKIAQSKQLVVNRSRPDIEFQFFLRREGFGVFGLRLTRHTSYEKILEKGELYPELAYILCYLSKPSVSDIFLDPFCGFGSIPFQRMKFFPYTKVIAGDINPEMIRFVREKAQSFKRPIHIENWDTLHLTQVKDRSITTIVTDPPWGTHGDIDISSLYDGMLVEFSRILRTQGILIILTSQKEILENLLTKYEDTFVQKEAFHTLVSGRKAGAYTLIKR